MKNIKTPVLTDAQKAIILGDKAQKPLAAAMRRQHPQLLYPPLPRLTGGRRDRMTILAGIICKEFVVVGADSRWTESVDGSTSNADKISIVDFGTDQVLVGQAGLRPVSVRIVEHMREKAKLVHITRPLDVTQVLEDSIQETKSGLDSEEKDYCEKWNAALLLAFYANNIPQIYKCYAFSTGLAEPAESHYATLGIASTLANYFLEEFSQAGAPDELQLAALIYSILKVKANNAFCGGPTTIKFVKSFATGKDSPRISKAQSIPATFIDKVEQELSILDARSKTARNREIFAVLREISDKFSALRNPHEQTQR